MRIRHLERRVEKLTQLLENRQSNDKSIRTIDVLAIVLGVLSIVLAVYSLYSSDISSRRIEALSMPELYNITRRFADSMRVDMRYIADPAEFALAYTSCLRGDSIECIESMKKYRRRYPKDPLTYFYQAQTQLLAGNFDAAEAIFDSVIAVDPEIAEAYNNRGNARAQAGKLEAAIADYNEALQLTIEDTLRALIYNNLGNAKLHMGKSEAALKDYDRAIRLNPRYSVAYNNRGNALLAMSQPERALRDFARALELSQNAADSADIFYNCAVANEDMRKLPDAIAALSLVLTIFPDDAEALLYRSQLYLKMGDTAAAIADSQKSAQLSMP